MRKHASMKMFLFAAVFCCTTAMGFAKHADTGRWLVKFRSQARLAETSRRNPAQLIQALQQQLDKNIDQVKQRTPMRGIRKLWAANAMAITASADTIESLKGQSNVEAIIPIRPFKMKLDQPRPVDTSANRESTWGVPHPKVPEVWEQFGIDWTY